ncbi:UvrD-helicase domain-containing protein [Patescibacteria group bacterium]|nr:UvrD-helicase domain-containing protein [Patescibacteria group bacterium]
MEDFLKEFEELNEAQKKAVLHKGGPLLVLAGAGAGKTKAISFRVAHLVSQGVALEKILAITFTNKASEEMKERIHSLLKLKTKNYELQTTPFVSTFHSLCAYILRKSGESMGVNKNFTILDKEDSLSIIKDAMKELNLDPRQFQPGKIQSVISRYKGDLVTNEEFSEFVGNDFFPRTLKMIWDKYEEQLKKQKSLDFDDLVLKTVLLLKKNKEVRNYYQNLWQHILIDEYQDTNKSQYELSKILADKHKNVCVIGDIDQAIYGWRGADFRNIINFEKDFPEHVSIIFEENYRSSQNILEAAAKVIEKNKMRKPKKLLATKEKGAEISIFEAMNEEEEAEFVAHKIKELLSSKVEPLGPKVQPFDIAVLYRANFQSRIIEESCLKHGLPYQVLGIQFYERKEIKDILAYIRSGLNPENLIDIKRIINVPPRGIGKVTILNYFANKKLPTEMEKKIKIFTNLLEEIKEKINEAKPSDVVRFILKESGYQNYLENGSSDDLERLENIKELASIAARYDDMNLPEGIEKMITDLSLLGEQDSLDKKQKSIRLMTVHAAKGLEFENVFIVGLEEGLFPHSGFGDDRPDKHEEERRLFYVALTRAKEKVFLSFSVSRMIFGSRQLNMPSQFLSDIPEHLLKIETKDFGTEQVIEYL